MKLSHKIAVVSASLIFSMNALAASPQIKCLAMDFDIKKDSAHPTPITLTPDESEYFIAFAGQSANAKFRVNIQKDDLSIFSTIELNDTTTVQTQGSFGSQGLFETSLLKGGNIMIPATSLSISCVKK